MTLEELKKIALDARKNKDSLTANLVNTLISEASKETKTPSDEQIAKTAKKFVKNLEIVLDKRPTDDAKREYELLGKWFMMNQATSAVDVIPIIDKLIADNQDKWEICKTNPKNIGWFTGMVMKQTNGKANPNVVREYIEERLNQ